MNFLADIILLAHFAFVLFILTGLLLIWLGGVLNGRWVRNARFRLLHAAAMLFVAVESVIGMACPLTVWENSLRGTNNGSGFVQLWVSRLLFYDLPDWVFTAVYLGVAGIILLTFISVPLNDKNGLFKHHFHR